MSSDNSPPRGTRDLLPEAVAQRDRLQAAITGVYQRFGYQRIETPALEALERLTAGQGGENEKLIFRVLRRGLPAHLEAGAELSSLVDLGLRYDLTVPLVRFYANNISQLRAPFRAFQLGPVWRAERPQRGRYRQFHQCDIDIIGEASVLAELELIEATTEALAAAGLDGVVVHLSDRRILSAVAALAGLAEESWPSLFVGLDKADKIGWEGVRDELVRVRHLPARGVDAAVTALSSLAGASAAQLADALPALDDRVLADLETTTAALHTLCADRRWSWFLDPTLVRGMGYYTGQIFEVTHPGLGSSVAGGGRYDDLIGRSLGRCVPACGFSIGFERVATILGSPAGNETVGLVYEPDVAIAEVLEAASALRLDGHRVATIPRSGKLGSQLDRLAGWGITAWVHLRAGEPAGRPLAIGPRRPS